MLCTVRPWNWWSAEASQIHMLWLCLWVVWDRVGDWSQENDAEEDASFLHDACLKFEQQSCDNSVHWSRFCCSAVTMCRRAWEVMPLRTSCENVQFSHIHKQFQRVTFIYFQMSHQLPGKAVEGRFNGRRSHRLTWTSRKVTLME